MTVVVETFGVTMDFVLAVGAHLGIPRNTDTLGFNALHVGSSAVFVRNAARRWWWPVGDSTSRFQYLAAGDAVAKETFGALALITSNRICARGVYMARRCPFITFQPVQALNGPVLNGNARLVKG